MQHSKPPSLLKITLTACALVCAGGAGAEQDEWRSWPTGDRAGLELAAFYITTDTDLKLDDPRYGGLGVFVNLEDALDLDESKWTPTAYAFWRVTRRNTLRYSYFKLDRSSRSSVEIDFGSIVGLPISSDLKTDFDIENHSLTWNYSFVFDETRDFYAGLGLAYQKVDLALIDRNELLGEWRDDFEAPIPAITVGYDWAFNPRWVWRNLGSFLALDLGMKDGSDLSGTSFSFSTSLEWRALDYVSVTAGYDVYWVNAENKARKERYDLDYLYHGPRLGLMVRF